MSEKIAVVSEMLLLSSFGMDAEPIAPRIPIIIGDRMKLSRVISSRELTFSPKKKRGNMKREKKDVRFRIWSAKEALYL
jgi:hypothetical protein